MASGRLASASEAKAVQLDTGTPCAEHPYIITFVSCAQWSSHLVLLSSVQLYCQVIEFHLREMLHSFCMLEDAAAYC